MKGTGRHIVSIVFVLLLVTASLVGFIALGLRPLLGLDLVGGVSVVLTAPEGTESDILDRTLETIRTRVDAFGVGEPDITRQGDLNIQVQIPEFGEEAEGGRQQRLLDLIGRTAQLEFRLVEEVIPRSSETYEETELTPEAGEDEEAVYLGNPNQTKYRLGQVLMKGDKLDRAAAVFIDPATAGDPTAAGWQIRFDLTGEGARQFATITRTNIGKQLAIALDEFVESAPNIESEIPEGTGTISGSFTEQEAKDLALVLKTGALPVELTASQVETVSPTLGRESLQQGLVAGIVGLIALALYLAFYYRVLGLVTWLGMATWTILTLAMVSLMGAAWGYSLTLAGIAGVIVSLAITADSYIVFYERLKDEVHTGKSLRASVGPAFKSAWHTIVAADVVSITGAVVLYMLAIGSVRGFALTLGLSVLLDMFVVYLFKRPVVFLIARSQRLSEMRGMGLRSGVAADAAPQPAAVRGGAR